MIGVVLWSDPAALKAVFWCEDHGDLAYYNGDDRTPFFGRFFVAGDMVEFEMENRNNLRLAYDAYVIEHQVCQGLQDSLRSSAACMENGGDTFPSKVVSLSKARARATKNDPYLLKA